MMSPVSLYSIVDVCPLWVARGAHMNFKDLDIPASIVVCSGEVTANGFVLVTQNDIPKVMEKSVF